MIYGLWMWTFKLLKKWLNISINITLRTRRSRNHNNLWYIWYRLFSMTHTHIYICICIYIYIYTWNSQYQNYRYTALVITQGFWMGWCVSLVKWRWTFNWCFAFFIYALYRHHLNYVHHALFIMTLIKFCPSYIISIIYCFKYSVVS